MYMFNYYYMCLYIGIYLYFNWIERPMPAFLSQVNMIVCWGFLLWSGFFAGRIILDCIVSNSKGQMTAEHMRNGIIMSLMHFMPTLLMSVFLLREGFAGK